MLSPLAQRLQDFLTQAKIDATVREEDHRSPYRNFKLVLGPKTKIAALEKVTREIAHHLGTSVPFISTEPGRICIELQEGAHPAIPFETLAQQHFQFEQLKATHHLPILIGVRKVIEPLILDLAKLPHLMIAGTTGSGKSTCEHAIIQSLILQSEINNVKLVLIDPKHVEFSSYAKLKCLKGEEILYDVADILDAMSQLTDLMETRLERFKEVGARDIQEYRQLGKPLSYTVVVIDELGSLLEHEQVKFRKEFARYLSALAAKGRAAGINLIACTQYPHSSTVKSTISTNFDGRIAFRMQSAVQSKVVVHRDGAEHLQGKGDGLVTAGGYEFTRFQGAFASPHSPLIEAHSRQGLVKVTEPAKNLLGSLHRFFSF